MASPADLTQHEIQALKTAYNMADAHTHQLQSPDQEAIVASLPSLWHESERGLQADFEERFIKAFFALHGQGSAAAMGRTLLSYSASISTMVAAMYLKAKDMTVSLVEPCFDNLVDLLVNLGAPPVGIPEEILADRENIYARMAAEVQADAVYLVDPNNPTGFSLFASGDSDTFAEVLRFCRDHQRLLIIDFCFASFARYQHDRRRPDVYQLLEDSGVTYIAIEDTGKTWPVQDAKCALLTCSADIYKEVYDLHTSVLLNVSPFVLNMLTSYIEDSIQDGFASVRDVLETNRAVLADALEGTILDIVKPGVATSVAWLEIAPGGPSAVELHSLLLTADVYTLPGTYFYWDRPDLGQRFLRVALARRPEVFTAGMRAMRSILLRVGTTLGQDRFGPAWEAGDSWETCMAA